MPAPSKIAEPRTHTHFDAWRSDFAAWLRSQRGRQAATARALAEYTGGTLTGSASILSRLCNGHLHASADTILFLDHYRAQLTAGHPRH
jgi:hypothetical protein